MVQTEELSDPITVQMRLPKWIKELIERVAAEELIPKSSVARRFLMAGVAASGVTSVPDERMNRTSDVQNIQAESGVRNG